MQVRIDTHGENLVFTLTGRLDAHGTQEAQKALDSLGGFQAKNFILDLSEVPYLSSAGLRFFLTLNRWCATWQGCLCLVGIQDYCAEVLRIGGLDSVFPQFKTLSLALMELGPEREEIRTDCGSFTPSEGSSEFTAIEVMGHVEDVLACRTTIDTVRSKPFSAKEYSLGLGALGPSAEDCIHLMGEMMTIGGTMVWLPTDGNDTPDFLSPKAESSTVTIRTSFNACLSGAFNEFFHFVAADPRGATLEEIYRAMFDFSKTRRSDYKGAIGLALRGEFSEVYGSGVVRAPVADQAPANGKWITDPSNFYQWFEYDEKPRHSGVTGLVSGVGIDHSHDLSGFNQEYLQATFYLNPANRADTRQQLHNHGVFFSHLHFPDPARSLEEEISSVVEEGDFVDMRHLLDNTRITRALIGVIYPQDFRPDNSGL